MNFSQGHEPEQKFNVNRACFPKEKHQNSQKWAKFMNFSFWPFFWFGLPGRLLITVQAFFQPERDQGNPGKFALLLITNLGVNLRWAKSPIANR